MSKTTFKPTVRQGLARIASTLLHPLLLPLITVAALTYAGGRTLVLGLRLAGLALLIGIVPVVVVVLVQVVRGSWTDVDVSVRRQRYILYPFGIACMLAAVVAFVWLGAPLVVVRAGLGLVAANVVNGLVNFKYKVSTHASTAALCAAVLWQALPVWGLIAAAAAALVGWSRVALGRHTPGQVVLGWGVGALCGAAAMLAPWPLDLPVRLPLG
jgi:membrane-associated phospholipid phosphatase